MKKTFLKVLCIGLLAAFVGGTTVSSVRAEDKPAAADAAKDKKDSKGRALPFRGKVAKIDKAAKSITLDGQKQRTLVITDTTRVMKADAKATIDDVTVGEKVSGSARETEGKWEAVSLHIGEKTKPEKKAK